MKLDITNKDRKYNLFQNKLLPVNRTRIKRRIKFINDLTKPNTRIQRCFSTRKTSSFFPNKDRIPTDLVSVLVYQYTCYLCSDCYTGEIKRHFSVRKGEHRRAKPVPSEISLHEHNYREENFRLVLRTPHTKIGEAVIYSKVTANNRMNKYCPLFQLMLFHSV